MSPLNLSGQIDRFSYYRQINATGFKTGQVFYPRFFGDNEENTNFCFTFIEISDSKFIHFNVLFKLFFVLRVDFLLRHRPLHDLLVIERDLVKILSRARQMHCASHFSSEAVLRDVLLVLFFDARRLLARLLEIGRRGKLRAADCQVHVQSDTF